MVKIQTEVDGYRGGCDGKEIHRNWKSTAIISISVIRVHTVFQTGVWFCYKCSRLVSGSAISVRGVVGSLSFEVQGRVCLAQFGPIRPDRGVGGGLEVGGKNWTFFLDVTNVWSITNILTNILLGAP